MAVSKTDINPATGKMYAVNPATGVFDDNWWSANEAKFNAGSGSPGASTTPLTTESILDSAKKMQTFYKEQNQPVVQSMEASKAPLKQRYDDLLASIKTNQTTAENRQTVTTANELGKRGIVGSSGIAQTEMTNALNPITSQYTGLLKDTSNQQNIDLASIDKAIAQLLAGNPESSISAASGIASAAQNASQFQQTLENTQKQQAIANALVKSQADQTKTSVIEIGGRKLLINNLTGETIKDLGSKTSGGSSGGAIDWLQQMLNG